jgi:hypothetical protein
MALREPKQHFTQKQVEYISQKNESVTEGFTHGGTEPDSTSREGV